MDMTSIVFGALIFMALGWMIGYGLSPRSEVSMSTKEYNAALNRATIKGYNLGFSAGRQEALMSRYTPNEIRKAFGFEPFGETNVTHSSPCSGCFYENSCGQLIFGTSGMTEEEAFELYCCGCACGDGCECNRDSGCGNYSTEGD